MAANGNESANGTAEKNGATNENEYLNNNEQSHINGGLASQQQQQQQGTESNDTTLNNDNNTIANGTENENNNNTNNNNATNNNNNNNNNPSQQQQQTDNNNANSHHYNQNSTYNDSDEKKSDTNNNNSNGGGNNNSSSNGPKIPSRFQKRAPSSQIMKQNSDFDKMQDDKMAATQKMVANMYEKKDETDGNGNNSNTQADTTTSSGQASAGVTPSAPVSQHPEIDRVISKLMTMTMRRSRKSKYITATQTDPKNMLTEKELEQVCQQSRKIFMSQPMLIEIDAPIKIVGDIHGQYFDLLRLFELGGMPPDANYVFLGDYVDRGRNSLEVISLLLSFKIKYPGNFFLLRGNHECASINRIYGFFDECKRRYKSGVQLWKKFCDVFNCLPVAAVIDDKIFCMHGGLSPDLRNFDQIRKIRRPTDVPDSGLLCDLLWADPDKEQIGWGENDRGVSYTFGPDILAKFLRKHDMDLVCRAHQVVEDGYEFFGSRRLVTIFSAPNYCGEFDNAGAMMSVDDTLMCSFHILKPTFAQKGTRFYN